MSYAEIDALPKTEAEIDAVSTTRATAYASHKLHHRIIHVALQAIKRHWQFMVEGTGVDPSGVADSTVAINNIIASASAVGATANRMVRVRFPDGVYLTDGIQAQPNTWLDFGNAVIKKRINGTTTTNNSLLRAVPVATDLVSTVTNRVKSGSTVTLTVAAAHDYVIGSIVVVAGINATYNGTHTVTGVPSSTTFTYTVNDNPQVNELSTPSGGTATRTKYYGTYKNMKVTGGILDSNGKTCPAHIVNLIFCEDLVIEDVRVKHNSANLTWAFCVGGRNLILNDLKVDDGTQLFQDGLHIFHGQNIRVNGGDFNSGDDAIALGAGLSTDAYLGKDPDPVRNVIVTNYRANSQRGSALRIHVDDAVNGPLWEITNVEVHGIVGKSGQLRNGGILIYSHQSSVDERKMVRHVNVDGVNLEVGSATHDDVNAIGVDIVSSEDIQVDFRIKIIERTVAPPIGWDLYRVRSSIDVQVRAYCRELGKRYGIDVRNTVRPTVLPGTYLRYGANQDLNPINFADCTDPKVLGAHITNVRNGVAGIICNIGTTTDNLTVAGSTIEHRAGVTVGVAVEITTAALRRITLIGNDFTKARAAVSSSVITAFGSNAVIQGNQGLADTGITNGITNLHAPPSGISVATSGRYNPFTNIYRKIRVNPDRLWAKFEAARAGTGLVNIVCLGDSFVAGDAAGGRSTNSWPARLKKLLGTRGLREAGTGIVNPGALPADSRWVLGLGWTASTSGVWAQTSTLSSIATFTSDVPGTVVRVVYPNNSGAFAITIDGGSPIEIVPTGATNVAVHEVAGLSNTTHTVVITSRSSIATVINYGVEVRPTSGVVVTNFGVSGYTSTLLASNAYNKPIGISIGAGLVDLYIICIGTNDMLQDVPSTTVQTNLTTILGYLTGSDVMIFVPNNVSTTKDRQPYHQVWYATADDNNLLLVDIGDRWGSYSDANSYGLMGDTLHPGALGHSDMARVVFGALQPV